MVLIERELPRYRAAILDGTALRRLPNVEAIFVVANLNRWDDELSDALTEQLRGCSALSTFAALIVPPGYGVEKSTLDEISDATTIAERIDALGVQDWPSNEYLALCLRRLRAAAKGRDANFGDDDSPDLASQ